MKTLEISIKGYFSYSEGHFDCLGNWHVGKEVFTPWPYRSMQFTENEDSARDDVESLLNAVVWDVMHELNEECPSAFFVEWTINWDAEEPSDTRAEKISITERPFDKDGNYYPVKNQTPKENTIAKVIFHEYTADGIAEDDEPTAYLPHPESAFCGEVYDEYFPTRLLKWLENWGDQIGNKYPHEPVFGINYDVIFYTGHDMTTNASSGECWIYNPYFKH